MPACPSHGRRFRGGAGRWEEESCSRRLLTVWRLPTVRLRKDRERKIIEFVIRRLAPQLRVGEIEQGGKVFHVLFVFSVAVMKARFVARTQEIEYLPAGQETDLRAHGVGPQVVQGIGAEQRPRRN